MTSNKEIFYGFTRSLEPGLCPSNMEGWVQNGEWWENLEILNTNKLTRDKIHGTGIPTKIAETEGGLDEQDQDTSGAASPSTARSGQTREDFSGSE